MFFFLDYYVIGKLDVDVVVSVIKGIVDGCEMFGCVLVGGEIVEMLGMYYEGDYDLVGFCVGVVEKLEIIDGIVVKMDDILIVFGLSGVYLNGYLLICKVFEVSGVNLVDLLESKLFSEYLLVLIKIYVKLIL